MARVNGAVLYQGPSLIDGKPIVAIVTGLARKSANAKTGHMVQTWILRSDVAPLEALNTGADASICGGCPHRPKSYDGTTHKGRSCYVNVGQGPTSVWRAFKRGVYPVMGTNELAALCASQTVRLGSYGDPAAVPLALWRVLVSQASGHTGYTHQWKSERLRAVTELCQASVDNVRELEKAQSLGLGTFRVRASSEDVLPGEIVCPASEEAGKVTDCASCKMCHGSNSPRNVVIVAHGIGKSHVEKRKALPVITAA